MRYIPGIGWIPLRVSPTAKDASHPLTMIGRSNALTELPFALWSQFVASIRMRHLSADDETDPRSGLLVGKP